MDGEIAFVTPSKPMDVDPPVQPVAQPSSSGMLSREQHTGNVLQMVEPPGLSLDCPAVASYPPTT